MGTRTKESRRRIHSLILLIAFTAILLIVSTYAWFTTQKDVTISNLKGTIEVAESLEISLDGQTWSHEIDLNEESLTTGVADPDRNIIPEELKPVSSLGTLTGDSLLVGFNKVSYNGGLITKIEPAAETSTNGYFAFDIYLKNLSKLKDPLNPTQELKEDILKLNSNSFAWVLGADATITKEKQMADANGVMHNVTFTYVGDSSKGLQNTLRVAFARYGDGTRATVEQGAFDSGAQAADVIANKKLSGAGAGTDAMTISSVAIWEPNADMHTESIYSDTVMGAIQTDATNNTVRLWDSTDSSKPASGWTAFYKDGNMFKTKALKYQATSVDSLTIDPKIWTNTTYFDTQNTIQTSTYYETDEDPYIINPALATAADGKNGVITLKDTGNNNFTLAANSVTKMRVYVWMEGQDPDCVNDNTHGGGIELQIGLVKSVEDGDITKRTEAIGD